MQTRSIKKTFRAKPVLEGAGVHLKRVFGFYELPQFDPFLLFDDFRNEQPEHYIKGFPWHPHRGIETITYMLEGFAEHGDSMGNAGTIGPGDVQWMTAGSGIIHQEMPKPGPEGKMHGFQLWANLPASHKMMGPRYQEIKAGKIPVITLENGIQIRLICGEMNGFIGPVRDIVIDPEYLDITIPPGAEYTHPVKPGYTVFIYVIGGSGEMGTKGQGDMGKRGLGDRGTGGPGDMGKRRQGDLGKEEVFGDGVLVLFKDDGDHVGIQSSEEGIRFLLVSGKPLNEPIAWGGPIVMNTREELNRAFEEFRSGRFIKKPG